MSCSLSERCASEKISNCAILSKKKKWHFFKKKELLNTRRKRIYPRYKRKIGGPTIEIQREDIKLKMSWQYKGLNSVQVSNYIQNLWDPTKSRLFWETTASSKNWAIPPEGSSQTSTSSENFPSETLASTSRSNVRRRSTNGRTAKKMLVLKTMPNSGRLSVGIQDHIESVDIDFYRLISALMMCWEQCLWRDE